MDDSKEDDEKAAEEEINEEDKEERQERTFLTFSDFDTFRRNFPQRKPRETQQVGKLDIQELKMKVIVFFTLDHYVN